MSKMDNIICYDKYSGECIDNIKEVSESVLREEYISNLKRMEYVLFNKPQILTSKEIEDGTKMLKLKPSCIEEFDRFEEYFTGNKEKLKTAMKKLSDPAYKCFSQLVTFFASCENTIQFGNHINIIKDYDFARVLEISENKWRRVKKELILNRCIRKIRFDKKVLYKINPTIIGHSMKITKCTYYAFRSQLIEEFSTLKSTYWDKRLIEEFGSDILIKSDEF